MKSSIFVKLFFAIALIFTFCEARVIDNFNMKERFRDIKNYLEVVDIKRNIKFNDKKRELDVYYKKEEVDENNLKPVVIFIHGGTWYEGDRIKFTKFGSLLKDNGYVGVLPEYILFPHGDLEDMVYDVYTSAKWTFENIKKYGGDPNKVTIVGHSSGAHILALTLFKSYYGMKNNKIFLEPLPEFEKVMLLAGIYDFDDFSLVKKYFGKDMDNSLLEQFVKVLFKTKYVSPYDILKEYPANSVKDSFNARKILVYHTSEDELVPVRSSEKICEQLRRLCGDNINLQYVFKEGFMHDDIAGRIRVDDKVQQDIFLSLIAL
eukprot:jgi/Orpsp1_1/1190747/evm.model.d7180000080984.1